MSATLDIGKYARQQKHATQRNACLNDCVSSTHQSKANHQQAFFITKTSDKM